MLFRSAASDARHPYAVTTAPSMRMVVSLADWDDSRWINLTGVSGHAFSAHYDDQTDLYAEGRTLPWAFSRSAVDASAQDRLSLVPASDLLDQQRIQLGTVTGSEQRLKPSSQLS